MSEEEKKREDLIEEIENLRETLQEERTKYERKKDKILSSHLPKEECRKRIEEARRTALNQRRSEIREEMIDELEQKGWRRASLTLQLEKFKKGHQSSLKLRDQAKNLKEELREVLSKMDNNKAGETKKKEDQGKVNEKKEEKEEKEEFKRKIEKGEKMIKNLEDRIKNIDRINRELSTRLEMLSSLKIAEKAAIFWGGLLLLIGGITLTGGIFFLMMVNVILPELPRKLGQFLGSSFLILGIVLIVSGFLHQV